MEFNVGENVVHPAYGAGEIVDVEHQELVEGFKHYYVIEFRGKRLTVRVPVRRTAEVGLRAVMSGSKIQRVLDALRQLPDQFPKNFKQRRRVVEEMIQSGYPIKLAEVVRDLTWRREESHLTKSDSEQLSQARERLLTELALATEQDMVDVQAEIEMALEDSIAAKRLQQDREVTPTTTRPS